MASKPQPPGKTVNIRPPPNCAPSPQPRIATSKQQAANREQRIPASNCRTPGKTAKFSPPQTAPRRPNPAKCRNSPDQIANGKPQPRPQISDRHGAIDPQNPNLRSPTRPQPQAIDRKIPKPQLPNRRSHSPAPRAHDLRASPPPPRGRFSTTPHPTCRAVSPFYPPAVVCYKSFSHVIHMVRFSELPSDFLYCFAHMVYNNT